MPVLLVAAGGMGGVLLRYGLTAAAPSAPPRTSPPTSSVE
jgi:hypothetical protein